MGVWRKTRRLFEKIDARYKGWWENQYEEKRLNKRYVIIILATSLIISVLGCILNILNSRYGFVRHIFGNNIIDHMVCEANFLGSAVLTLSTILGALTVFFYSSLVYKNFGFSNRKIVAYTYGRMFFPCVLAVNVIIVVEMMIAYYVEAYCAFYIFSIYSCLLQGAYMIWSVYSTTQRRCRDVLVGIEIKQFKELSRTWNGKFYAEVYASRKEQQRNDIVIHMDNILRSDETMKERLEMMRNILIIPFKEFGDAVIGDENADTWATYNFYYQNLYSVAVYMKQNSDEAPKIFSVFYETISEMQGYITNNSDILERRFLICLSALFITFVPYGKEDVFTFLAYIVNHVVKETKRREIIPLLYLKFLAVLWVRGQIDLNGRKTQMEWEKLMASISDCCAYDTENIESKLFGVIMVCGASGTDTNANGNDSLICRVQEAFEPESEMELFPYLQQILLQKRKQK